MSNPGYGSQFNPRPPRPPRRGVNNSRGRGMTRAPAPGSRIRMPFQIQQHPPIESAGAGTMVVYAANRGGDRGFGLGSVRSPPGSRFPTTSRGGYIAGRGRGGAAGMLMETYPVQQQQQAQSVDLRSRVPCRYAESGICIFGPKCPYKHPDPAVAVPEEAEGGAEAVQAPPGSPPADPDPGTDQDAPMIVATRTDGNACRRSGSSWR